MKKERLTLYVSDETRERSARLLEAVKEETPWMLPPLSRNAWLNILLSRGMASLEAEIHAAQEA